MTLRNQEKRRYIRVPVEVEFMVKEGDSEQGLLYFAARDVSLGGAFLRSEILFELDTILELVFHLPGEDQLHAQALVVRVSDGDNGDEPGMGIRFDSLHPRTAASIKRFVSRMLSES
jgi:uncharacterized protein (TIGR02266 family)